MADPENKVHLTAPSEQGRSGRGAKHTPEPDALRFAAEWLRAYDDSHDGGEQAAIASNVADWLDAQADAKEIRDAARAHGVPVKGLRARIAKATGSAS